MPVRLASCSHKSHIHADIHARSERGPYAKRETAIPAIQTFARVSLESLTYWTLKGSLCRSPPTASPPFHVHILAALAAPAKQLIITGKS